MTVELVESRSGVKIVRDTSYYMHQMMVFPAPAEQDNEYRAEIQGTVATHVFR
jgi:hypothetical protein